MSAAWLVRLDDALARGEDLFLAVSHAIVAGLVIAAVFFRYVLSDPLIWSEEFIVIVFTWMLFVGLSSGFRARMHLRVDALLVVLPERWRSLLGTIAVFATMVTLLGLVWFGIQLTMTMAGSPTPMMRISSAWALSAVPAGAALSCIHILRHAICDGLKRTLWPDDLIGAAEEEAI
ncbi:TRAP transporter small permease [Geminicoccus harenae]|uniref:TRAP transporter small permease n=1 Tax=Geminicoccus harenae TaxID=2498453 RepID=UPI00168B8CF9|nr:TRAP transporter small permease [Geminicoccus harenae]